MKTLVLRANPRLRSRKRSSARRAKKRTTRVRRNPPKTKHFYVSALVFKGTRTKRGKPKFKTMYYSDHDDQFHAKREDTVYFQNETSAKYVARKLLTKVNPDKVYALRIVKA